MGIGSVQSVAQLKEAAGKLSHGQKEWEAMALTQEANVLQHNTFVLCIFYIDGGVIESL